VKLKPKDAATSSKDPTIPVAASDKRVNEVSLLSGNNAVLDKFINSGNSSVNLDTMSNPDLQKLKRLKKEKEDLEEDEDDDWDSDDGKPQKTAAQKKLDAARVVELNAEILALAESLAIEGLLLDSDVIDDSNNKVAIYQRIKAALESVDRSIGKKDSIYQSVNAKLVGLRGGVAEKSSVVAALKDNLSLSPLPAGGNLVGGGGVVVAAVDIDAQVDLIFNQEKLAIEEEVNRLQEELDLFNQKERREKGPAQQKAISDLGTQLQAYTNEGKIAAKKMLIKIDLTKAANKKK